jgi:serine/threonine protein kinase
MRLISVSDAVAMIPEVSDVSFVDSGSQKCVFRAKYDSQWIALKFVLIRNYQAVTSENEEVDSAIRRKEEPSDLKRVKREMATMSLIRSPFMSRLGQLAPRMLESPAGQWFFCYSESWIDGQTLRDILQQHAPISITDTVRLADEMAQAIGELEVNEIVHRDVKPGNIMRRMSDGHWVLLDLGICLDLADTSITGGGIGPHTPAYCSPEQLDPNRKNEVDTRSDMFSLGVVLYEASTGVHPLAALRDQPEGTVEMAHAYSVIKPSSHRRDYPRALEKVVMRLMGWEPFERYNDWQKVRNALARILL